MSFIKYIADESHYKEVLSLVEKAKRTVWIGTADIKDLYVDDKPFLALIASLLKKGVEVRLINPRYHRLELYGTTAFCPTGTNALMVYTRPMSATEAMKYDEKLYRDNNNGVIDYSVKLEDFQVQAFIDDKEVKIRYIGKVLVRGVKDNGDIKNTDALNEAYMIGLSI